MRRSIFSLLFVPVLALSLAPFASAQKPAPPAASPAPAAPVAPAKEAVSAADAAQRKELVGKEVSVSGRVAGTGRDERSGMVFLNFSRDRNNGFVTVIKGSVAKGGNVDPKAQYEGKDVTVPVLK